MKPVESLPESSGDGDRSSEFSPGCSLIGLPRGPFGSEADVPASGSTALSLTAVQPFDWSVLRLMVQHDIAAEPDDEVVDPESLIASLVARSALGAHLEDPDVLSGELFCGDPVLPPPASPALVVTAVQPLDFVAPSVTVPPDILDELDDDLVDPESFLDSVLGRSGALDSDAPDVVSGVRFRDDSVPPQAASPALLVTPVHSLDYAALRLVVPPDVLDDLDDDVVDSESLIDSLVSRSDSLDLLDVGSAAETGCGPRVWPRGRSLVWADDLDIGLVEPESLLDAFLSPAVADPADAGPSVDVDCISVSVVQLGPVAPFPDWRASLIATGPTRRLPHVGAPPLAPDRG